MITNTTTERPPVMTMTDAAVERVCEIMASRQGVVGLKLGIKKGGCAGMEYTMDWATEADPMCEVVESGGATILIEPMAIMYLLGTEMDYEVSTLSSGFSFNNPNQQSACGCGESVELQLATEEKLSAYRS
ncbi:MAG: HesB/IscA family protein [Hyphomicrobiaceae bacterium]